MDKINVFNGKRVLVTGSTGFKGSWLSLWLKKLGAKVYGFALEAQEELDNFKLCNLHRIIDQTYCDIRYYDLVRDILRDIRPEIIFHLAAQPIVLSSFTDPMYTIETNVMGTTNILEAARTMDCVKSIVVVTSDKCYRVNNGCSSMLSEDDPLGGKDPYSASKACEDILATSYYKSFFKDRDIGLSTARAGNVIGGGDRQANRILPDCIRAIEKSEDIVIRNPHHIRPWQHVLEPLYGYIKLASSMYRDPVRYSGAWNFGPPAESHISVGDLGVKILECLPGAGVVSSIRLDINKDAQKSEKETEILSLDSSKAVDVLGIKNILDIDDTIRWTVEDYFASGNVYKQRVSRIDEYEKLTEDIWS